MGIRVPPPRGRGLSRSFCQRGEESAGREMYFCAYNGGTIGGNSASSRAKIRAHARATFLLLSPFLFFLTFFLRGANDARDIVSQPSLLSSADYRRAPRSRRCARERPSSTASTGRRCFLERRRGLPPPRPRYFGSRIGRGDSTRRLRRKRLPPAARAFLSGYELSMEHEHLALLNHCRFDGGVGGKERRRHYISFRVLAWPAPRDEII